MHAACTQVKFRQFKLEVSSLQMCVLLVVNEQKVTSMEELCTQLGTNERNLKRHVQALTRYRCIPASRLERLVCPARSGTSMHSSRCMPAVSARLMYSHVAAET